MKTEQKLPGNTEPVETKDRITDAAVNAEDTENKEESQGET